MKITNKTNQIGKKKILKKKKTTTERGAGDYRGTPKIKAISIISTEEPNLRVKKKGN